MPQAPERSSPSPLPPIAPRRSPSVPLDLSEAFISSCHDLGISAVPSLVIRSVSLSPDSAAVAASTGCQPDGGGEELDLRHWGAGDRLSRAVAGGVGSCQRVSSLCLRDNAITDRGAVDLLISLRPRTGGGGGLRSLDLAGNRIGVRGAAALAGVLAAGLTSLDLSGNRLGDAAAQRVLALSAAGGSSLRRLLLSGNLISCASCRAAADLMHTGAALEELDLSWNVIRGAGGDVLGRALASNSSLTLLGLAWNGLGGGGGPFDAWANALEGNQTLTSLDLSHNRLDERDAVVIAENVRTNDTLALLDLSGNPLGPVGGNLMFKLVDTFGSARGLVLDQCNFDLASRFCPFNPLNPQGRYALDLSNGFDRSVAKALVRIGRASLVNQAVNPTLSGRPFDMAPLVLKPLLVPRAGLLRLQFLKCNVRARKQSVIQPHALQALTTVASTDGHGEAERLAQVSTLAGDVALTVGNLVDILGAVEPNAAGARLRCRLVTNLFPRLVDRHRFSLVEQRLTGEELARVRESLGQLYTFNEENPTGHYRLLLDRAQDRRLADKILELNNEERIFRLRNKYADTSQRGNYMCFRNETLNGSPFVWSPTWVLPDGGVLEFDFTSTKRPSPTQKPLAKKALDALLDSMKRCHGNAAAERMKLVKELSCTEFFTADQVCCIIQAMDPPQDQVETAVILHPRVVDLENYLKQLQTILAPEDSDLADGRSESPEQGGKLAQVIHRLGWLNVWNPLDPDIQYSLDLSKKDEHAVTQCLVALAVSEPGENWESERLDGHEFELPSTWIKGPPPHGHLQLRYHTDHTSDDTRRSRLQRGDDLPLRTSWLQRTLVWREGLRVEDRGYTGLRESWGCQQCWRMSWEVPV